MAEINRIFGKTPLQGGPTQAPASYQTPVADAIGNAANVGSQFLDKYNQAKYNRDKTDLMLNTKKMVNDYQENLRTNPIVRQNPDDDIVALKEQDWQKFSIEAIGNKLFGNIQNPKLREDMGAWWANESENFRSNVVNSAIDEDIAYMGQRTKENIDTAIYEGQYALAAQYAANGVKDGVLNANDEDDVLDQIALQSVLKITGPNPGMDSEGNPIKPMTMKEAQQFINESGLEADEKIKANKWMVERRKVYDTEVEAAVKQYDDGHFNTLASAIITDDIRTTEGMLAYLDSMPDAQLGEDVIEGSSEEFKANNLVKMNNLLKQRQKERDAAAKGEKEPDIPPGVEDYLERLRSTGTHEEMLDALWKLQTMDNPPITTKQANDYKKKSEQAVWNEQIKDPYAGRFDDKINSLLKDKTITVDDAGNIRRLWNDHVELYNDEDTFKEKYNEDMDQFFKNLTSEVVKIKASNLSAFSSVNDLGSTDKNEAFAAMMLGGSGIGIINPEILVDYINNPSPDDNAVRDKVAIDLYGTTYDKLEKGDDKKRVNYSLTVGAYGKLLQAEASNIAQKLGTTEETFIDEKGVPFVIIDGKGYRLGLNKEGTQEVWQQWGLEDGEKVWFPIDTDIHPEFTIKNIPKPPSAAKTIIKDLFTKSFPIGDTQEAKDNANDYLESRGMLGYPGQTASGGRLY